MWEVSAFILGFIIGGLFVHSLTNFLYVKQTKMLNQLKLDLEDLYAKLKGLAKNV